MYGKVEKGVILPFINKNRNGESKVYFVKLDVEDNKLTGIKLEKEIRKEDNKDLFYSILNLEKKMNDNA